MFWIGVSICTEIVLRLGDSCRARAARLVEDLLVCGFDSLCLCRTSFSMGSVVLGADPTGLRLNNIVVKDERKAEEGRWGASAVSIMVAVCT